MIQKSSLPQVIQFVSEALMPDMEEATTAGIGTVPGKDKTDYIAAAVLGAI